MPEQHNSIALFLARLMPIPLCAAKRQPVLGALADISQLNPLSECRTYFRALAARAIEMADASRNGAAFPDIVKNIVNILTGAEFVRRAHTNPAD